MSNFRRRWIIRSGNDDDGDDSSVHDDSNDDYYDDGSAFDDCNDDDNDVYNNDNVGSVYNDDNDGRVYDDGNNDDGSVYDDGNNGSVYDDGNNDDGNDDSVYDDENDDNIYDDGKDDSVCDDGGVNGGNNYYSVQMIDKSALGYGSIAISLVMLAAWEPLKCQWRSKKYLSCWHEVAITKYRTHFIKKKSDKRTAPNFFFHFHFKIIEGGKK